MPKRRRNIVGLARRSISPGDSVDGLFAWLMANGDSNYDPGVTQLEHALQSADLAAAESADSALVVAALLHDVGHLLADEHTARADFLSNNLRHESIGANWLQARFQPAVSLLVRHHVEAKRYLCATDRDYRASLSDASKRSLVLQGGPMSDDEIARFEGNWWTENAIRLRRIDDKAKVPGRAAPALKAWRNHVLSLLL